MAGRFLSGFAGLYGILLPLYVGEIASKEIRGRLLSLYQIILSLGESFVFAVGHFASFTVLNIVCATIPLIYFMAFITLPESPIFLVIHCVINLEQLITYLISLRSVKRRLMKPSDLFSCCVAGTMITKRK